MLDTQGGAHNTCRGILSPPTFSQDPVWPPGSPAARRPTASPLLLSEAHPELLWVGLPRHPPCHPQHCLEGTTQMWACDTCGGILSLALVSLANQPMPCIENHQGLNKLPIGATQVQLGLQKSWGVVLQPAGNIASLVDFT